MIEMTAERYGDISLCNILADEPFEIPTGDFTHLRAKVPAVESMQMFLTEQGFFHADRMLKCSVNLKRAGADLDKKIRLQVIETAEYHDRIREIALKSFPVDRRFHVGERCCPEIAQRILNGWVDRIDRCYVCLYKDIPVGFAALEEREPGVYEIVLAAVDEAYRMTGAAVTLYAYLVKACKEKGGRILYGWISSVNMAVMNVYASLGAAFSEPSDIFLKTVKR